jgi:hypothetical protein
VRFDATEIVTVEMSEKSTADALARLRVLRRLLEGAVNSRRYDASDGSVSIREHELVSAVAQKKGARSLVLLWTGCVTTR